eukprot:scaffold10_cov257-Pinguiococcus_pyrenoidosus.AAC.18
MLQPFAAVALVEEPAHTKPEQAHRPHGQSKTTQLSLARPPFRISSHLPHGESPTPASVPSISLCLAPRRPQPVASVVLQSGQAICDGRLKELLPVERPGGDVVSADNRALGIPPAEADPIFRHHLRAFVAQRRDCLLSHASRVPSVQRSNLQKDDTEPLSNLHPFAGFQLPDVKELFADFLLEMKIGFGALQPLELDELHGLRPVGEDEPLLAAHEVTHGLLRTRTASVVEALDARRQCKVMQGQKGAALQPSR